MDQKIIIRSHTFDIQNQKPITVFIQGKESAFSLLNELPHNGLAIVGTRSPQSHALSLLQQNIKKIAKTPLIIISGFARGIDSAAHLYAIEYGLKTIAVLPTGLGVQYPRENFELRQRILKSEGLVISEYPHQQNAYKSSFLKRNRLLVLLSNATWVVQAGYKSGALNTANWAIEFDKPLFVTPCFPGDLNYCGNEHLLKKPHGTPFWSAEDLSAVWLRLFSKLSDNTNQKMNKPLLPGFEKYLSRSKTRFEALEQWCTDHNEKLENWIFTLEKSGFFE